MQLSATDTLAIAAEDGKNTMRLALDNEHEDFLYSASQADPIAPSGGATSQARLYDGPTAVSASSVAWAVDFSKSSGVPTSGTNAPTVSAAGLLTVKHITAAAAKVVVKATYPKTNGQVYYAEFTANKTSQDKYDLRLVPNAIAFNESDAWTDKTITPSAERTDLQGNRTTGTINTSEVDGLRLYYSYVNTDGTLKKSALDLLTTSTFTLTETNAKTYIGIYFELRLYSGSSYRMCDYETVEIAKSENGAEGPGGAVATVTPGELSVQCDKDGKVATAISSQALSFVLTVGGVECTNVKATRPTSGVTPLLPALPNGVSVSSSGGTIVSISVAKQYAPAAGQTAPVTDTMLAAGATFLVKGTDATGNEVTSRCTLGLKGLRQGEQGGQGNNAVTYDFEFPEYSLSFDVQTMKLSGKVKLCVYKHDGSTTEFYTSTAPQISFDGGTTWDSMTMGAPYYTKDYSAGLSRNSQPATANFRVVINSKTYATAMPITVKGDKGETGRMFYMMGDWSASTKYERSEEVVPMVFYNDGEWNDYLEVKGGYYYLIQSSAEGENQKPGNTTYWKRCDDYGVILTQGIFADFAKLGSAIFSGDWMFSQHGKIGDTIISSSNPDYSGKKGYLYFDAGAPTGNRTLGVSGSVADTQVTRIGGFFELSSGCKIIKVNARVNGSGQTMIVAVRKGTKTSNLGYVNVTSTTNSDYYIIIKDIDNASDYYVAANMNGSGGGFISGAELVAFVPNYAVDLLTGKAYMNNAAVKGSVTVSNSDTQSITITPSGITARWDNDGFRLTADGLERYDSRSGKWGPMFAGRRVDVITVSSGTVTKYIDKTYDFILARNIVDFTLQLPSISVAGDGKVFTIQSTSQNRSVIVKASGSDKFIAGSSQTTTSVSVNNYERLELISCSGIWYAIKQVWESS